MDIGASGERDGARQPAVLLAFAAAAAAAALAAGIGIAFLWPAGDGGASLALQEKPREATPSPAEAGSTPASPAAAPTAPAAAPAALTARGRLVCLAEEMQDRHGAQVPPVHDHLLGLRLEGDAPPGAPRYYTLLRTPLSEALFADERFRKHDLVVTGRTFPGTLLLEVTRFQWRRDGKLHDVFYYCDVCSIRGVDPGLCACCQGKVELREEPAQE